MEGWLQQLIENPMHYIGWVFSVCAALYIIYWGTGFFSKAYHIFTFDAAYDHLHHARVRCWVGVLGLLSVFILWEILRWIAGLFS